MAGAQVDAIAIAAYAKNPLAFNNLDQTQIADAVSSVLSTFAGTEMSPILKTLMTDKDVTRENVNEINDVLARVSAQRIKTLEDELTQTKSALERAEKDAEAAVDTAETLQSNFQELQGEFNALQAAYDSLNEDYTRLENIAAAKKQPIEQRK